VVDIPQKSHTRDQVSRFLAFFLCLAGSMLSPCEARAFAQGVFLSVAQIEATAVVHSDAFPAGMAAGAAAVD